MSTCGVDVTRGGEGAEFRQAVNTHGVAFRSAKGHSFAERKTTLPTGIPFPWSLFPVSDRHPPEITESIAEAIRAGLALIAVVLLARANVGALTRAPSVWVVLLVGLLVWGAAAWVARWSPWTDGSRLRVWRDCLAPALISLVMAGRGGAGALPMAVGFIVIGSVAVGFIAGCCRTNLPRSGQVLPARISVEAMEPMAEEPNGVNSPRGVPEPMFEREGESEHGDQLSDGGSPFGECNRPNTPAPDAMAATQHPEALPADLAEIVDSSVDESGPAESWTRTETDGEVSIEAVMLARFAEGSKLAVVHLPFVPPLPSVPQIECEPLESGCDVTIKTEAAYRHGARLSVTRPTAGPAESVPIGVMVYTSAEEPVES